MVTVSGCTLPLPTALGVTVAQSTRLLEDDINPERHGQASGIKMNRAVLAHRYAVNHVEFYRRQEEREISILEFIGLWAGGARSMYYIYNTLPISLSLPIGV